MVLKLVAIMSNSARKTARRADNDFWISLGCSPFTKLTVSESIGPCDCSRDETATFAKSLTTCCGPGFAISRFVKAVAAVPGEIKAMEVAIALLISP